MKSGTVCSAKPAVLTSETGISGMKKQCKSKRMLNRWPHAARLFNIRYTSDFYFTENSIHKFCKEFSVVTMPARHTVCGVSHIDETRIRCQISPLWQK